MRIFVAALVALTVGLAAGPAHAFFVVHALKVKANATAQAPGPDEKLVKGKINNKVLVNLVNNVPLDTPLPKNQILVLLTDCTFNGDVRIALWDKDAEELVANGLGGLSSIPFLVRAVQEQTKNGESDRANMALQFENAGDLLLIPGTMTFKPLGKKFPGQEDTICASGYKSQSVGGYVDGPTVLILKGKVKAGKPIAIFEP
jgi:hypothetical protein